jgi:FkbM family methyltransferase
MRLRSLMRFAFEGLRPAPRWRQRMVAAFTRLYPFYSGGAKLANHQLVSRLAGRPKTSVVWAKSPGGYVLSGLNDVVGQPVFFFGDLDSKITWVLGRILRPGDTALDIGANLGVYTLIMARAVGASGSIHAFEPNPQVCATLLETLARNRVAQVKAHEVALADRAGVVSLAVPPGNKGSGSLIHHRSLSGAEKYNVRTAKLDDIVSEHGIRSLAAMKIDVEGSEPAVIAGGVRTIETFRPIIVMEVNDPAQRDSALGLLRSLDYEVLGIPKCMLSMRTVPISVVTPDIHDVVAVPMSPFVSDVKRLLHCGGSRL